MDLKHFFKQHPSVALAFSGGVDSAYLLYEGMRLGCDIHAYYLDSPLQPRFELEDARRLAEELNAPFTVLSLDLLKEDAVTANPKDRCYYCKQKMFSALFKAAGEDGYDTIIDGTNASDDASDRPGMRALTELSVLSPLKECGITKAEVRIRSKDAGLFTWNKPAYACLATRIPAGTAITAQILSVIEESENALSALGFSDFRIRLSDGGAKLQIKEAQFGLLLSQRKRILELLKPYFSSVTVDLEVRL